LKSICISRHWIQPPTNLEVNLGERVNIGQFGPNFLKSSTLIQFSWNLNMIYITGHWIQPPIIFFVVNIDQKVNTGQFLKLSILIQLTWNLKSIWISGHWIQQPINFEVNIGQNVKIGQKANLGQIFENPQFSSNWLEIWRAFSCQVAVFNYQLILRSKGQHRHNL